MDSRRQSESFAAERNLLPWQTGVGPLLGLLKQIGVGPVLCLLKQIGVGALIGLA